MIITEDTSVDGAIVINFAGLLTVETAPAVRLALMKAFAMAPELVIADVRALEAASRAVLAVFPASQRHGPDPAAVLVLCAPSTSLRQLMGGRILGDLGVYRTRQQALEASRDGTAGSPRVTLHLPPTDAAPSAARAEASNACRAWGIGELSDNAALVVSELVTNAVAHARTDIHVSLALRRDYLHIRIRDRAPMPAGMSRDQVPEHDGERGRGLYFVGVFATAWGMSALPDGKVVWATLRATPMRPSEI